MVRSSAFVFCGLMLLLTWAAGARAEEDIAFTVPEASYRQVWVASLKAMTKSYNLSDLEEKEGYLKGSRPGWYMWEWVKVFITPAGGEPPFRVRVVSSLGEGAAKPWGKLTVRDIHKFLKLPYDPKRQKKSKKGAKPEKPLFTEHTGSPD